MNYEKQTWAYKDEITAEKLNHMEQGIVEASQGGGTLVIRVAHIEGDEFNPTNVVFDKTFSEVEQAFQSLERVVVAMGNALYPVIDVYKDEESFPQYFAVGYIAATPQLIRETLKACSEDGYLQTASCSSSGGGGGGAA